MDGHVSQQAPMAIQRLSGRYKAATETAHCPDTSVVPSATKPTMMAPNGSCSNLNWMDRRCDANENRQRIDCKREQPPAGQAEHVDVEKNADDVSGDNSYGDRAFHQHGAIPGDSRSRALWNPSWPCQRAKFPNLKSERAERARTARLAVAVQSGHCRPAGSTDGSSTGATVAPTRRRCRISRRGCRAFVPCRPGSPGCRCRGRP